MQSPPAGRPRRLGPGPLRVGESGQGGGDLIVADRQRTQLGQGADPFSIVRIKQPLRNDPQNRRALDIATGETMGW